MIGEGETAPGFVEHWASELGASVHSLVRLRGGINNRVFRCSDGNQHWVIKGYAPAQPGQRDRMQAEVDFLRYSAQVAPGFTPELIQADPARRCVVLEHIAGEVYPDGFSPPQEDVKAAIEFFRQLNSDLEIAREMIQLEAAEGFLSLRQHMANVRERLSVMRTDHLPLECKDQAAEFLRQLYQQAERVELRLEAQISSGVVEDNLDAGHRCVSPSDFGFHNAIRAAEGVKFIDFEFAGWDDPSKMCADFILQQRNPIRLESKGIVSKLFPSKEVEVNNRMSALSQILRLKWVCILLGFLNPSRLNRMIKLGFLGTQESIAKDQLNRCREYMAFHLPLKPP